MIAFPSSLKDVFKSRAAGDRDQDQRKAANSRARQSRHNVLQDRPLPTEIVEIEPFTPDDACVANGQSHEDG